MHSVLAHAQLAVGRLAPARATAGRALTEVAQVAGLREAVGRSTALGLCRVWWALASAHLGRAAEAQAALEALLAEEKRRAHSRPCTERTDSCARCCGCGAISPARSPTAAVPSSWRRSAEAASLGWRPRRFSAPPSSPRGDLTAATSALETALALARRSAYRAVVRAAHPGDARGRRSGPPATAREPARSSPRRASSVDRGRGWRLGAFDVELAWVRLLASEPASDRTAIESALESLDALAAELGADPYRRIAALERARLAT